MRKRDSTPRRESVLDLSTDLHIQQRLYEICFAASWDDLGLDTYMADGGRYRRRRFAAFAVSSESVVRKAPQPHYQSRDYNPLNGGIERRFGPVTEAIAVHPVTLGLLDIGRQAFDALTPAPDRPQAWHVELHQFGIEARAGQTSQPTPEGLHRDGVDWVLVVLVDRKNVESGVTSIFGLDHSHLGDFTLTDPLDAVFLQGQSGLSRGDGDPRVGGQSGRPPRCRGHHLSRGASAPAKPRLRRAQAIAFRNLILDINALAFDARAARPPALARSRSRLYRRHPTRCESCRERRFSAID
jgi:hypothetical protein